MDSFQKHNTFLLGLLLILPNWKYEISVYRLISIDLSFFPYYNSSIIYKKREAIYLKRFLSAGLALVLAMGLLTGCGEPLTPDSVVATIGDQNIYAYEMTYLMKVGATKEEAMEELLNFKTMVQKAYDSGVTLNDTDRQTLADDKASMVEQYGSQEALNEFLSQLELTEAQFDLITEESYLVNKLNSKATELGLFTEVTDEQAKEFFDQNFLRAKHILFKTTDDAGNPLDEAAVAAATQKAEETLAAIKNGAPFEDYESLSEDPGSATSPDGYVFVNTALLGDDQTMLQYLYQVGIPIMVDSFEQATAALQVDQVSELVTSEYGIHIIKRLDLADDTTSFESMKEQIKAVLNNIEYDKVISTWRDGYKVKTNEKYYDALEVPEPYQPSTQQTTQPETTQQPETSQQPDASQQPQE